MTQRSLKKWGIQRMEYLQEYNKTLVAQMSAAELYEHCLETEDSANAMYENMMSAIRANPDNKVTEKDKANDQMAWVGRMNNFRSQIHEVIYCDLIYS